MLKERVKNYNKLKEECIEWIRKWFDENGKGCNAIIGLSGGKDSTIVAKLCVEALGADRVIGVAMPDYEQGLNDADKIAEHLGIRFLKTPIENIVSGFHGMWMYFGDVDFKWSVQSEQNIPPRIRMTMLYAIAQTFNGRVVGTCNASENFLGYATKFGDMASDLEPLGLLTVHEVKLLGYALNLPKEWVDIVPNDGLPHSCPDEEKFGFTYEQLDEFIINEFLGDEKTEIPEELKRKMIEMHNKSLFKIKISSAIDTFNPQAFNFS